MIQQFYINLDKCVDKRQHMQTNFPRAQRIQAVYGREESPDSILPYRADLNWRDPYHNRRMTNGEVGCTLSHIRAWKLCEVLDRPIVVLEDDAEIVDPNWEANLGKYSDYEFLYLGRKHMSGEMRSVNDDLETGGFCYWTIGYYITPRVAKLMLQYCDNNPLIPADELIPAVLGCHRFPHLNQNHVIDWACFKQDPIRPVQGAFNVSDTESLTDIWQESEFHTVTIGTDPEKCFRHEKDDILNLGLGVEWKGGTMQGPGGGQKINIMKEYLSGLPDNDIVLFVDGYDTFLSASKDEILHRYYQFAKEIVFSAEPLIWPDKSIADQFEQPEAGVPYLNSGTYIGTVKALRDFFSESIEDHEDDQLYAQRAFLSGKHDAVLDHESYIFFCLSGQEDNLVYRNGWVVNSGTRCTTCVVHGNGGGRTKDIFEKVYHRIYGSVRKETHGQDIIILKDLLTREWCQKLIDACEDDGGWRQLPNDKFPGQEIRLNTLKDQSLMREFREFYETIERQCEAHWPVLKMHGIRDLFVIKYAEGVQTTLPLHHDMSLVSGMVKLNDDFTGGETNFPRQNFDTGHLAAGDIVLWPAQVSHPHESLPLKSGTKYGLVLWTQRYDGEGEYRESN